jgi:hypothetical protein
LSAGIDLGEGREAIQEWIGGERLHNSEGIYSSTDTVRHSQPTSEEMRLWEDEPGFAGY